WNLLGKGDEKIPLLASANGRGDYQSLLVGRPGFAFVKKRSLWMIFSPKFQTHGPWRRFIKLIF
ncbi:hypothetical protein, partial [Xanthomonas phaseoli]